MRHETDKPKPDKRRAELLLASDQLPGWLREVAAALESGSLTVGEAALSVAAVEKISIEIKGFGGESRVKLKARLQTPLAAGGAEVGHKPAGSYGSLKKRMKRDFRAFRDALLTGSLPPAELTQAFLADCDRMVAYPGKGDEDYPAFAAAAAQLDHAVSQGDLAAVRSALDALAALKHSCHAKHK